MSREDSKVDIAADVQEGISKANEHERDKENTKSRKVDSTEGKATQFDGNPAPAGDREESVLRPHDDTPATLEKREGPKNP